MNKELIDIEQITAKEFFRRRLVVIQRKREDLDKEETEIKGYLKNDNIKSLVKKAVTNGEVSFIDQVRMLIKAHGGLTNKDIAQRLNADLQTVRFTTSRLMQREEIRGEGTRDKKYYWNE